MSYRTHIQKENGDSVQIMGNNEFYEPLLQFLADQGCEVDMEEGVYHDCEIKDASGLIHIFEDYIEEQNQRFLKRGINIFDLTPEDEYDKQRDLTQRMTELRENAYIFVSAVALDFFKDEIVIDYKFINNRLTMFYQLREGAHIFMSAG